MEAGESATVVLPPEQAFGPIRDEEMRTFPLDSIPEETRQVGRQVMVRSPEGEERMLEVVAIHGDKVTIDFNHELAGQTLRFEIRVVSNEPLR